MVANVENEIRRAFEIGDLLALRSLVQTHRYEVELSDVWRLQAAGEGKFSEEVMFKFMEYLIFSGCGVTQLSSGDHWQTLLHRARYPSLVQLYVDHGADVDALDHEGMTPLCRAVENNLPDVVSALLRCDADRYIVCRTMTGAQLATNLSRKDCEVALSGFAVDLNACLANDSPGDSSYSW